MSTHIELERATHRIRELEEEVARLKVEVRHVTTAAAAWREKYRALREQHTAHRIAHSPPPQARWWMPLAYARELRALRRQWAQEDES